MKKAQKIKVSTILELDGVEYNIDLQPVGKKATKKIQKTFNKERDSFSSVMDSENEISALKQEVELINELIEVEVDLAEKKGYILEKRILLKKINEINNSNKDAQESAMDKVGEITENMYESLFDAMVSGDDADKLKAYVNDYSFKVAVEKVTAVYDEEISAK